jgi:hypothetical protein
VRLVNNIVTNAATAADVGERISAETTPTRINLIFQTLVVYKGKLVVAYTPGNWFARGPPNLAFAYHIGCWA